MSFDAVVAADLDWGIGKAGALQAEMAYPQRGHNDRGESPASGRKRKDRCNGRRHAPVS